MIVELVLYAAIAFLAGVLVYWTGQWLGPVRRKTPTPPPHPPPITSGQRFIVQGLLVVFLAMGALAWSLVYTARQDRDKTADWQRTPGIITTFESQDRVDDTQMSMVGDVSPTVKEVVIRYTYSVAGEVYTNDKIHADERLPEGRRLLDPEDADTLASDYPEGQAVTVYYDPDDPQQAVLKQDENRGLYLVGLNAGLAFLFAAGVVARWLMTHRH